MGSRMVARSVPEDQHANQDERGGNGIPDKVHPMDALTTTEPGVFVIAIKTILALHITNQPQRLSVAINCRPSCHSDLLSDFCH